MSGSDKHLRAIGLVNVNLDFVFIQVPKIGMASPEEGLSFKFEDEDKKFRYKVYRATTDLGNPDYLIRGLTEKLKKNKPKTDHVNVSGSILRFFPSSSKRKNTYELNFCI